LCVMSGIWKKGKEKGNWKHWSLKALRLKRGVELAGCCLESSLWGACVRFEGNFTAAEVLNPDQSEIRYATGTPLMTRSYAAKK
jgi:hypothetical protein